MYNNHNLHPTKGKIFLTAKKKKHAHSISIKHLKKSLLIKLLEHGHALCNTEQWEKREKSRVTRKRDNKKKREEKAVEEGKRVKFIR